MENKGQFSSLLQGVGGDVKFYGQQNGVNIYCKPGTISFVFTKVETTNDPNTSEATEKLSPAGGGRGWKDSKSLPKSSFARRSQSEGGKISTARMDLVLINSNPKVQITPSDQQEYYENFYTTPDSSGQAAIANNGITNVHSYKTITYKNIYPKIDLVLKANQSHSIEYSFIVYPGGNVKDIQMQWNGTDSIKMLENNGGIKYVNSLGYLKESGLKTYLDNSKAEINSSYAIGEDHGIGFEVGDYDNAQTLVIDPTLIWATYFGGTNDDDATGVISDASGNVYIAGSTLSNNRVATSGAYQTSYSGGSLLYSIYGGDAFLAKFSNSGSLLWATYYGGSGSDRANGLNADAAGNVYIVGTTTSKSGIATSSANQTSLTGDQGAFLAKFSKTGTLIWATYYAGNYAGGYSDKGNSVKVDGSGNVYITGYTRSDKGVATTGAFQTALNGYFDAFLAKFNSAGSLVWATYYGGNGDDFGYCVSTDLSDNIYITGATTTRYGMATSGAYQTSLAGDTDAFIAKFSGSGSLLWATYFGGKNGDFSNAITIDLSNNVYIAGQTNSDKDISTSNAYQTSFGGDTDVFLAKFNSSGAILWATYYGGNQNEKADGLATDALGNVYITGQTRSFGIATPDGYQTYKGSDDFDAFLAKFSSSGNLTWATYYGSGGYDIGNSVCVDAFNDIFIAGATTSASSIATSGAYQTSLSGASDAFLAKFQLYITDVGVLSVQNPKNNSCSGLQPIELKIKNFGTGELDSVTINWAINGIGQKQYHWKGKLEPDSTINVNISNYFFNPGIDTLKFWTSQPNGVEDLYPKNDSSKVIDTVYAIPTSHGFSKHIICSGDTIHLGKVPESSYSYLWASVPSGFSSVKSNPNVVPIVSTSYYLTETIIATGCSSITDTEIVVVNPLPASGIGTPKTICNGTSTNIGLTANNHYEYKWTSNPPGFTSTNANATVSPTVSTTYKLIEKIDSTGCSRTDSVTITVNPLPLAIAGNPQTICVGRILSIGSSPIQGHTYSWSTKAPNTGFSSNLSGPFVNPTKTTTYTLTEYINATGCRNSNSVVITVNPLPKPNAGNNYFLCLGDKISLGYPGSGSDTYQWSRNPSGFSSNLSKIIDSPNVTSTYILKETNPVTGCTNQDTAVITVVPPSKPVIIGPDAVCGFDSLVTYSVDSIVHSTWTWTVKEGAIVSGQGTNSIKVKFDFGFDTVSVTEVNKYGCAGTISKNIRIRQNPDAHFKVLDHDPEYTFNALDSTAQSYTWNLGDSTTSNLYKITHQYNFTKDTLIKVSLMVMDQYGCSSIFDTLIDVKPPVFNIKVFPNPFENATHIQIELDKSAHIYIIVYDAIGRLITTLANAAQSPGAQIYTLDGDKYNLSDGVYFLKILVDDKVYVRAVVRE